jgi:Acetyltransferase (GNAT) domain
MLFATDRDVMTGATVERVANTPDMVARFVAVFRDHRVPELISNLVTEVREITVAGRSYPLTLNAKGQRDNCYICNPVTAYIDYAIDETRNFTDYPALRKAIRGLILMAAPLVRTAGLDQQVQINNWLFSTNPVPTLGQDAVAELRDRLTQEYPTKALVLRSLNGIADAVSLASLRVEGFRLLPARQIYLFDGAALDCRPSPNMKQDLRAMSRSRFVLVEDDAFTTEDYARSAELYEMLYVRKYTPLNPRYTALYVRAMHQAGLMRLRGLRDPDDGRLVAVTGLFENGRTLTQPIVGYDTSLPMREGLYRMVMAMAQDHARQQGLFFNMSAGAASFKRLRQARPVIEYSAVYVGHLPLRQRLAVRLMEMILTRIGIPLLQRYEL